MNYSEFVRRKFADIQPCGFDIESMPDSLFPHQKDLVRWAVRRGRVDSSTQRSWARFTARWMKGNWRDGAT